MAKRRRPPSQGWRTFLRNHADAITSMDLFVVPTFSFSAAAWISDPAAFPPRASVAECDHRSERRMDCAPTDRSLRLARNAAVYRSGSRWRLWQRLHPAPCRDGDTDRPISARSPCQNGYTERVIGSIRRDASIMSWCAAKGIFVICSIHTKNITMRSARTSRCARTRRSRVTFRERAVCFQCQS